MMPRPLAALAALCLAAAPLAFSITAAAPRRVVRVQVIGAPFEFVLAQ